MALKRFNGNHEYYYDTVGDTHELTDNDIIPFTHKPGTEDDEDGKVKLSELKKYMNTVQDNTIIAIQAKIPSDASSTNKLATSDGVANSLYGFSYFKDLDTMGWYKICTFGKRYLASTLNIDLNRSFNHAPGESHKIKIAYSWNKASIEELASCGTQLFDKIRICYNDNNYDTMAIYVHYNASIDNDCYFNVSACQLPKVSLYNFETDSIAWSNNIEFNLGSNGVYQNGEKVVTESDLTVTVDNTSQTTLVELLSSATAQMNAEQPYICKLRGNGTGLYTGNIMTYQKSATPVYAMALLIRYDGTTYKCKCLNGTWTTTAI